MFGFGFIRKFYEFLERIEAFKGIVEFIQEWVAPFLVPIATALAGYWQGEPVMWIMAATSIVFMCIMVGWAAIFIIKEKTTPQNKLSFQVVYQQDLDSPIASVSGNRQQRRATATTRVLGLHELLPQINRKIEKAQIGIEITNNSPFPISVILELATTVIAGEMPPRSVFPKPAGTVGAWSKIRVLDDAMEMDGIPCQRLSAQMDMVVKYGKKGKEKFMLNPKGVVDIVMTDFGFVSQVVLGIVDNSINLQTSLPILQVRKS